MVSLEITTGETIHLSESPLFSWGWVTIPAVITVRFILGLFVNFTKIREISVLYTLFGALLTIIAVVESGRLG